MKNILILLVLLLFVFGCAVSAVNNESIQDDDTGRNSFFKENVYSVKVFPETKIPKRVRGICYLSDSLENFVSSPCNKIAIILRSEDGKELDRKTTDDEGRFSFSVPPAKVFFLSVDNDKYFLASDKLIVSAGAEVLIRLIKKESF